MSLIGQHSHCWNLPSGCELMGGLICRTIDQDIFLCLNGMHS